jgi:PAS domain S-box-containing protein
VPQSAEILHSIIESAESGIITIDAHGVVQTFSPAAERLFGYQSGEMIERNVSLLMPEPDHSAHDGYINDYLTSGVARIIGVGREVTGLRKDGTRFPLHISVGKFAIDGQTMFTGIVHDLTAEVAHRNSLRASEERFQQLVANIDEMFMLRTVAPIKYIYVSPAVEKIYGVTVEQALADPEIFFTVIHPDDAALVRKTMIEADENTRIEMESRIVRPDGELRWVWIRYRSVESARGEPRLVAITVSDITARRAAQRGEEAARAEAERANDAKSEFLSRMSHELRTPLNAILGFSQLLAMDELNTDQHEAVRQINRGGRHLLELINEVLDISRIGSGQMTLSSEAVFVSDVIDEVLDLMGPLIKARKLLVTLPPVGTLTEHVLADRQRLKQVLLNLVSNAIKYNRDEGQVSLSCAVQPHGMFAITVSDTGIGVPPGEIDRLFAPFDRLGAENTDVEGTGVGLALSLALVQTMGGRLEVESALGVGSSFTVLLPLIEAAAPQVTERSPITNGYLH